MSFALWDAGLISYTNNTVVKPIFHKEFECNTVNEEKIEKREVNIKKQIFNNSHTNEKIKKMYTITIQQQIKDEQLAKKMWDELKSKYTANEWYLKWQILN